MNKKWNYDSNPLHYNIGPLQLTLLILLSEIFLRVDIFQIKINIVMTVTTTIKFEIGHNHKL